MEINEMRLEDIEVRRAEILARRDALDAELETAEDTRLDEVEKEVDEQLKDEPRGMGFCFSYWSAKRAALARRGIEWRSPSAMNPRVMFD